MRGLRRWVAVAWAGCLSAGCGGDRPIDEQPPPPGARSDLTPEASAAVDEIAFHDPALAERYERARACLARRAPGAGWAHHPAEPGAGLREERWCSPDGPCAAATGELPPGQTSFHLRTMTLAGGGEERLSLVARETSSSGWMTTVTLQPWTGGFAFHFVRGDEAFTVTPEHCVAATDQHVCAAAEEPILPLLEWHDREVYAHTASSAALRDRSLAALSRLRTSVERSVADHTLTTCDDPSAPDRFEHVAAEDAIGLADTCVRRPLSRAEEQRVLRAARADIAAREALVRRSHAEWHAALVALFPLDTCWLGRPAGAEGDPRDEPLDGQDPRGWLEWTLTVDPSQLSLSRIGDVEIHIRARNRGLETIDPGRTTLRLTLDGESHLALDMAFGNGATGREWRELLPGHVAHDSRIGVRFVDTPGHYVLALRRGDRELATTTLDVRP